MAVRGMDIFEKMLREDTPPFIYPKTTRACGFARFVLFGEVIGASKARSKSFLGAWSFLMS